MCGAVISLWPHESFDKRAEHREYLFKNNEEWNETCERITLLKQYHYPMVFVDLMVYLYQSVYIIDN